MSLKNYKKIMKVQKKILINYVPLDENLDVLEYSHCYQL